MFSKHSKLHTKLRSRLSEESVRTQLLLHYYLTTPEASWGLQNPETRLASHDLLMDFLTVCASVWKYRKALLLSIQPGDMFDVYFWPEKKLNHNNPLAPAPLQTRFSSSFRQQHYRATIGVVAVGPTSLPKK